MKVNRYKFLYIRRALGFSVLCFSMLYLTPVKAQIPPSIQTVLDSFKSGSLDLSMKNITCENIEEIISELKRQKKLPKVKKLDLFGNDLSELPESFGDLTNLEALWLYDNNLSGLPPSFGDLKKLKLLNLSSNKFSELPDSLGDLTNLETLILNKNHQLTTLPASLVNLTKLKTLNLNNNPQLALLPSEIEELIEFGKLIEIDELFKFEEWFKKIGFNPINILKK